MSRPKEKFADHIDMEPAHHCAPLCEINRVTFTKGAGKVLNTKQHLLLR